MDRMDRTEKMKSLYKIAEYLSNEMAEKEGININNYLEPEKCNEIEEFYEQALSSLCNRYNMKTTINFNRKGKIKLPQPNAYERRNQLKPILGNFKPIKVKEDFSYETLEKEIIDKLGLQQDFEKERKGKSQWKNYIEGIFSAATFLSQFKNGDEFDVFVQKFKSPFEALPMKFEKEKLISGFRFALSCDFLKESGYDYYAKPDRQLIDVFKGVGLCESDDVYEVFKTAIDMAKVVGKTAYEVDKRIWLVCTGKFYYDKNVIDKKKELIHCVRHIEHGTCKICTFTHSA